MSTVFANGRSIVHRGDGGENVSAHPDVCLTPSGSSLVPVPYVNIAKDSDLTGGSTSVTIEGNPAALRNSSLCVSSGDEAGTGGGVISGINKGKMTWISCSPDVMIEGQGVVRHQDTCLHNGNSSNTKSEQVGTKARGSLSAAIGVAVRRAEEKDAKKAKEKKHASISVRFSEISELFMHRDGGCQVPEALVYQSVRLQHELHGYAGGHLRTFVREHAQDLDGKYVYVFRAPVESPTPGQLELRHELKFSHGSFQEVALSGQASRRGHDRRAVSPAAPRRHVLQLEVGELSTPSFFYFFFLAPCQYPWKAVERLPATLIDRAARLFDPFWVDANVAKAGVGGDVSQPLPFDAPTRLSVDASRSQLQDCRVYLLDPMLQARLRAKRGAVAMQMWHEEVEKLGKHEVYALAKRVAALAGKHEELLGELNGNGRELHDHIERLEAPMSRAAWLARDACLEIVQWIGMEQTWMPSLLVREGPPPSVEQERSWQTAPNEIFETSRRMMTLRARTLAWRPPPGDRPFCEFSEMVRDFTEPDLPVPEIVHETLAAVYARLVEQDVGRRWLALTSRAYTSGKKPVADGGASVLFFPTKQRLELPDTLGFGDGGAAEAGQAAVSQQAEYAYKAWRKFAQLPPKSALLVFEQFVPFWDYKYLKKRVDAWGIELEEIPDELPRKVRLKMAAEASAGAREAAQAVGITERLRPVHAQIFSALAGPSYAILVGIEIWNVARMAEKLAGEQHAWTTKDTLAVANMVASLSSAYTKLLAYAGPEAAVFGRASPVLALVGGICDTVSGGLDMNASLDESGGSMRSLGQGLRLVGSIMAVTGAVTSMTGIGFLLGAAVGVVGIVAQVVGNAIVATNSDARVFLRYCQWGSDRGRSNDLDNGFGYHGNLRNLQDSLMAQHRAISYLCFPFKARFGARRNTLVLEVEVPARLLTVCETGKDPWTIDAKMRAQIPGAVPRESSVSATGFPEPDYSEDPIRLRREFACLDENTLGVNVVAATITFDPYGNERFKVTRTLRDEWVLADGRVNSSSAR